MSTDPNLLLDRLLRGQPVDESVWRELWSDLDEDKASPAILAAALTAASTQPPHTETLIGFVQSLQSPVDRATLPAHVDRAVNIVGTGGGPSTFNLSTAAAIVAASAGAAVVKTGSRGYSSKVGATEFVERAGFPVARTTQDVADHLAAHGIAFAGPQVYPSQLARVARRIVPVGMKLFGAFLNQVGPFLPTLPVSGQLTGVSNAFRMSQITKIAASIETREIVLASSQVGADELMSFCRSLLVWPDGEMRVVEPGELVAGDGSLDDLAPVAPDHAVEHLHDAITGRVGPTATATIVLNAAVLLQLGAVNTDLAEAVDTAHDAIASGVAGELFGSLASKRVGVRRG